MLAPGGVSHLDLCNRLIPERRWSQKRVDGTRGSEHRPRQNRLDILAQTLGEYPLELQSLDFSNNGLDSGLDAYIMKADNILTKDLRHAMSLTSTVKKVGPQFATTKSTSSQLETQNTENTAAQDEDEQAEPSVAAEPARDISVVRASNIATLRLHSPALGSLIHALQSQNQLTAVDLSENRIGVQGARALAEIMAPKSCMIQKLDLGGNRLGDQAAIAVSKVVGGSQQLQNLCLRDCDLGDVAAISLAKSIEDNRSIGELDLSWNHIRARGAVASE